ncbi:MAG: hypothetical protein R2777_09025 [Chitinophagales bacterium]
MGVFVFNSYSFFPIFVTSMQSKLQNSIEYLKGVGPKSRTVAKELNIFTWEDLLHHYPFRYVDKSKFYEISAINNDTQYIQISGKLKNFIPKVAVKNKIHGTFEDNTGTIDLVWFSKIDWIQKSLKVGAEYVVYGKPKNMAEATIFLTRNKNKWRNTPTN